VKKDNVMESIKAIEIDKEFLEIIIKIIEQNKLIVDQNSMIIKGILSPCLIVDNKDVEKDD
jgi:hypothetical protein